MPDLQFDEHGFIAKRFELAPSIAIDDVKTLRTFADALRLRILRSLYTPEGGRALSPGQIREAIGEPENTRLYYHVGLLEKAGLIRVVHTQKKRNMTERYYAPVAGRLRIAPSLFLAQGDDVPSGLVHMAQAYIGALEADVGLLQNADPAHVVLAHREFHLEAEAAQAMRADLEALLEKYEALKGPEAHRVTIMAYPR